MIHGSAMVTDLASEYVATALLNDFPPTMSRKARFVLTLHAYFDESGTHADSHTVTVAGYIARPEQWTAFDTEWRQALSDFGIDQFHMVDFANGAQAFATCTKQQRETRFLRLAEIIDRNVLASVGMSISRKMFNAVFPKWLRRAFGGPYGLASSACAMDAVGLMKKMDPDAWIAYRFESGAPGASEVGKLYRENLNDPERREKYRLLNFAFESKSTVRMFQAADILAYELYQHLPRQTGESDRPPRRFHLDPLGRPPHVWGFLNQELLEHYAAVLTVKKTMLLPPIQRRQKKRQ